MNTEERGKGALIALAILAPFMIYGEFRTQEKSRQAVIAAEPKMGSYNAQGEEIILGIWRGSSSRASLDKDLHLPKAVYRSFLEGKILDPVAVAEACGKSLTKEQIQDDTVLGSYKFFSFASESSPIFKIIDITPRNLRELKELIEKRTPDPKELEGIKTSWLQRELKRNWVSANKEPQLG